jgi:hypothetical protein
MFMRTSRVLAGRVRHRFAADWAEFRMRTHRLRLRLKGIARFLRLRRQIREVTLLMTSLDKAERVRLLELLVAADANERREARGRANYRPSFESYAKMARTARARLKSDSRDVRLQGIAMWIKGAARETELSPYPELNGLHPEIQRIVRNLRASLKPVARAA